MPKTIVLFLAAGAFWAGTPVGAAQPAPEPPPPVGVTRFQPWRPPPAAPLPPADAARRADLIRHVEVTEGHRPYRDSVFPLAGALFEGRTVWAAEVRPDGQWWSLVVYERGADGGWRDVGRHELSYDLGNLTAAPIEPTQAWIVAHGGAGARGIPTWDFFRFDGDALHHEDGFGVWPAHDVMFVDVDRDGVLDLLSLSIDHVHCYYCGLDAVSFDLHRWNGTEIVRAPLAELPAGAASDAAVAANNRAVALARAGRWAEAAAVVDAARFLVAEHAVFRRNAALVDVTAGPGSGRLSGDLLLHYVFAGRWTEAVDLFRNDPLLPGFLADGPPYEWGGFATSPWLLAIRNATSQARGIAPARPEIEFLHAWAAFHLDPDTATMGPYALSVGYAGLVDTDDAYLLDALDRAVRLAPDDPLFVEARRIVARRANVTHPDAMRRAFLLFDGVGGPCAGPGCAAPGRRPGAAPPAASGAAAWNPWRPPPAGPAAADAALHADLIRHFAATSLDADAAPDQVTAFPLAGGPPSRERFWAVFHPAADLCRIARRAGREARFGCTKPVLVVHARRGGAWREAAHHVVPRMETFSDVAPVDIERSQPWMVIRGFDEHASGTRGGAPFRQILRFDGESLHVELEGYWLGFMVADVDGDGAGEILRRDAVPLCHSCGVARRAVELYRWTGTRLARVPLEFLPAGSAPAAAVAANNRAVALARARRWTEAAVVLDTARPLVAEHPAFGRNAVLIDLNAAAPAGDLLSEDPLLDAVFAGAWARAVGRFRASARRPDVFAGPPPFPAASVQAMGRRGVSALVRTVFDATAAARAVAPARPEIEFLHAWAAWHLDPDLAGPPPPDSPSAADWASDYRIDVDPAAVVEVLERSAALAPGDRLFVDALQVVGDLR